MKILLSSTTLPCIIVVVAILLPISSCDLIDSTCKQTPNYQLCHSILGSNPRSRNADITGLSLIMVDAVKSKVVSTLSSINRLEKLSPQLRNPLNECRKRHYVIFKYDVSVAIEALEKGDPKFAVDSMNDAAIEAQICEEGFKPSHSPLTGMNKAVIDMSLVAAAVMKNLL